MKTLPFLTTNEYDDMALDIIVMLKNYEYSEEEILKILNYAISKCNHARLQQGEEDPEITG